MCCKSLLVYFALDSCVDNILFKGIQIRLSCKIITVCKATTKTYGVRQLHTTKLKVTQKDSII